MNKINNSKYKRLAIFTVIAIPILILIIFLLKNIIHSKTSYFPECFAYKATGYLCPACGNTRSVLCLLDGHILTAFKYNITPPVIILIVLGLYIELVFRLAGIKIKIIPKNNYFLFSVLSILIAYYILRNVFSWLTIC